MKAILMNQPGGTETLRYADVPTPEASGSNVLVRLRIEAGHTSGKIVLAIP